MEGRESAPGTAEESRGVDHASDAGYIVNFFSPQNFCGMLE